MVLSDEDILKFQALCKSELGIEVSREDAYEQGVKLLRLMSIVYKPMTEEELDAIQNRRKDSLLLLINKINEHEPK